MNSKSSPFEVLHVNSKKVSCDGGNKSSSHPLVYLNMGNNESIVCPYCSKTFVIQKDNKKQLNKK
ncbi:MAG: zinc-finger domain-containing protein [Pelagibacterales bacterium]|nr:zinc-finger domain-containing protein [Pelagibacterales bacterium]